MTAILPYNSNMVMLYKKESVELISDISLKVVANLIPINDTMPHTRTVRDIGTLYAVPIHIQGMSAVRLLG